MNVGAPRLPEGLTRLCFSVLYRGRSVKVHVRPDRARYMLGAVPTPGLAATDATSGIAVQSGTLTPPGTASGAGTYTFTATATDNASNTTTVVVHYTVDYFFGGPCTVGTLSAGRPIEYHGVGRGSIRGRRFGNPIPRVVEPCSRTAASPATSRSAVFPDKNSRA